jgi:hypothetical protein
MKLVADCAAGSSNKTFGAMVGCIAFPPTGGCFGIIAAGDIGEFATGSCFGANCGATGDCIMPVHCGDTGFGVVPALLAPLMATDAIGLGALVGVNRSGCCGVKPVLLVVGVLSGVCAITVGFCRGVCAMGNAGGRVCGPLLIIPGCCCGRGLMFC